MDWISAPPLNPWALETEPTVRGRQRHNKHGHAAGRSHSQKLFKEGEAPYSEMTPSSPLINNFTKGDLQAALIDSVSLRVPVPTSQAHVATATVCSSNLGRLLWVLIQSGYSLLCVRVHTVNHWAATCHVAQHSRRWAASHVCARDTEKSFKYRRSGRIIKLRVN